MRTTPRPAPAPPAATPAPAPAPGAAGAGDAAALTARSTRRAGRPAGAAWEAARRDLDGLPGGRGLNIAHEAVDRHALGDRAGREALRWRSPGGEARSLTYGELRERTDRLAGGLDALGLVPGGAVAVLLDRVPELYLAVLATWKHPGVVVPLSPRCGPRRLRRALALGGVRTLVTSERLYRRRVAPVRDRLPGLDHVVVAGPLARPAGIPGSVPLDELVDGSPPRWEIPATDPATPASYQLTAGPGGPLAAVHVHEAVVAHHATASVALDLQRGGVVWCTADPGSALAVAVGIVAPLTHGATVLAEPARPDAARLYRTLQDERVGVWCTSPGEVRGLRRTGGAPALLHDLSHLRFVASTGGPLDADDVEWSRGAWGIPVHDGWGQAETGAVVIANTVHSDVRPGSMGHPLPGVAAAILATDPGDGGLRRPDGHVVEVTGPGTTGHLALRPGWPSMFRGYLGEPARYRARFVDGWYVTGDLARRDRDGSLRFAGRARGAPPPDPPTRPSRPPEEP